MGKRFAIVEWVIGNGDSGWREAKRDVGIAARRLPKVFQSAEEAMQEASRLTEEKGPAYIFHIVPA
jgi:hypothetical protein